MVKKRNPTPKVQTHFEQVPVATVKKVAVKDAPPSKAVPANLIVERKTEPYSVRIEPPRSDADRTCLAL
jgi:hypothetical protein